MSQNDSKTHFNEYNEDDGGAPLNLQLSGKDKSGHKKRMSRLSSDRTDSAFAKAKKYAGCNTSKTFEKVSIDPELFKIKV